MCPAPGPGRESPDKRTEGSEAGCSTPVHARGIANLKVCVVCGANDLGDSFCRVYDGGRPSDEALLGAVGGLGPGTRVATDGHRGYARVLPSVGVSGHVATEAGSQRGGLGMVNALHQRLKLFLEPFHGVSTRWLDHYLLWFAWLEQARRSDSDRAASLSGQAAVGVYELARRATVERPQPFWDYWVGRMSTVV